MEQFFPLSESLGLPFFLVFAWSTLWKGIALYRAANEGQKNWFIAILVLSTLGILEIIYLFWFAKKKLTLKEIKSWIPASKG